MKQIQNMETAPMTSPALFNNAERELESLPHQSLLQATKVHYGERPDLKSKLFFVRVLSYKPTRKIIGERKATEFVESLTNNL